MRCIEILLRKTLRVDTLKININMRCIEIAAFFIVYSIDKGLTLTWDVLKFIHCACLTIFKNRLTLTWDVLKYFLDNSLFFDFVININMRCIEMNGSEEWADPYEGLTLTWDVLKCLDTGK